MTLEKFIEGTFSDNPLRYIRPRIFCIDGFHMSVQGSMGAYSSPRQMTDKYSSLEIGFPSHEESLIMEYAETVETPTDTVYAYVPVDVVQSVIEKHGGINVEKTFKAGIAWSFD